MTDKIYYTDSYINSFSAEVINIIKIDEDITAIILNRTAFFPEGGGQSGDTGFVADVYIYDTQITDNIIYHYTKDIVSFLPGNIVNCSLDWNDRFAKMQSHTGEHILSGLAHNIFGANNVGFHMDKNYIMTVDFDIQLTKEQINQLEIQANKCIYNNLAVNAIVYSDTEDISYNFRSKKDICGELRIVTIGDIDTCACCAPHVNFTGSVGLLKIIQGISHRGGIRLTVMCGYTAFCDYTMKHNSTLNIASLLCSPHNSTDSAVSLIVEQNKDLKRQINNQKDVFIEYVSQSFAKEDIIIKFFNNFSMSELIALSDKINKSMNSDTFLFSGNDSEGYLFCFMSNRICLSEFMTNFKNSFCASGGGKGSVFQGKVSANSAELHDFIRKEANY